MHQLAVTGDAAVVVTISDDAQVPDPILALWKDGLADRLEVGPLTPAEVDEFATEILGGTLIVAAARELEQASLGNPLFVRELLLGARDAGYLVHTSQGWRFTARLRTSSRLAELIRARLAHASDDERRALELLSVAGHLTVDLLLRMATPDTLAALEHKHLITVDRTGPVPVVSLGHPAHADSVRDTMGEIRAHTR